MTLSQDIQATINRHSRENESNTPDFILAEYLMACLIAFESASKERERWYGMWCEPGGVRRTTETAPAVACDHFPGQAVCEWCKGTGAIDAPTSADDPSCPECDGEGHE